MLKEKPAEAGWGLGQAVLVGALGVLNLDHFVRPVIQQSILNLGRREAFGQGITASGGDFLHGHVHADRLHGLDHVVIGIPERDVDRVDTLMLTLDEEGRFVDRNACKLAFRNGVLPAKAELDEAVLDERAEIAAMDEGAVAEAEEMLRDAIDTLNASKAPTSRRALANARNQEIEVKSWDEWLDKYRRDVLDVLVPGEPLVRNRFMTSQEGYKAKAWDEWTEELDYRSWDESMVGSGDIVGAIQLTFRDGRANWITKRFGGFDLGAKLEAKANGIARFERAAVGFYAGINHTLGTNLRLLDELGEGVKLLAGVGGTTFGTDAADIVGAVEHRETGSGVEDVH